MHDSPPPLQALEANLLTSLHHLIMAEGDGEDGDGSHSLIGIHTRGALSRLGILLGLAEMLLEHGSRQMQALREAGGSQGMVKGGHVRVVDPAGPGQGAVGTGHGEGGSCQGHGSCWAWPRCCWYRAW